GVVASATRSAASLAPHTEDGVPAPDVTSAATARRPRADNDSNVLALGARTAPSHDEALRWLEVWLETPFAGGRHARRVDKIKDYESRHSGRT
ncbi:MAG: RpiB/LacA/LacB family sugar-phosphate isomerase, partial [bacterium]